MKAIKHVYEFIAFPFIFAKGVNDNHFYFYNKLHK